MGVRDRPDYQVVRIILVEDEPALQTVTSAAIRRAIPGAQVEVVDTAGDAIEAIVREEPALIVSDYDLADGSKGAEILAFIHGVAPELVARFLFVSGNAVCEEMHSRVIMKPYRTRELAAALHAMLA